MKRKILEKFRANIVVLLNFVPEPPRNISPSGYEDFYPYAGVLEPHKGVMELVKGFKEIPNNLKSKLIIVGNGDFKHKIEKYVKEHQLETKVLLLGYVEHHKLYSYMRDSRALIIPSKCPENCPLIALEVLSVGTPIITSSYGGLPEITEKIDRNLIFYI